MDNTTDQLSTRLLTLINTLRHNQLSFSKAIGAAQSHVNKIILGNNDISRGMLVKILNHYPDVSLNWLLTGNGSMFLSDNAVAPDLQTSSPQIVDELFLMDILVFNLKTVGTRWEVSNMGLFKLIDPTVNRTQVSRYMNMQAVPKVSAMVHLERITGVSLSVLLTQKLKAEDFPEKPIHPNDRLSALRMELKRTVNTINNFLEPEYQ